MKKKKIKRLEEAKERKKKELEEEEAKRKKLKEEEDQARMEATEQILQMGYDVKKALKALELNKNNFEAAVNWLLENSDNFNFEEEPVVVPEPIKEEKIEDEVGDDQSKSESSEGNPEEKYKPSFSSNYTLPHAFEFDSSEKKKYVKPDFSSEWEDRILPELKAFMEKRWFLSVRNYGLHATNKK